MAGLNLPAIWIHKLMHMGSEAKTLGEEELKQLLNNMALVATLLVTLTFAALFTIPGGYDQNNGRPLRIGEAAIQVFVASDVLAMLLGIAVLMGYLGMMSTGYQLSRLGRLASSSVTLLQLSIQFTLVTLLCGLYALCSGYPVSFWIFSLSILAVAGVQYYELRY